MMENLDYYLSLLEMNYNELVIFLKSKYGYVIDDYFVEKSYEKFLNGKIKTIQKGKYTKTKDGLYCHHVFENKYQNLSNIEFVKKQNAPFITQKKENLVYCNLCEHIILHTLIFKETGLGLEGLKVFLLPQYEKWYIYCDLQMNSWELNCYTSAYLCKSEAEKLYHSVASHLIINLL